MSAVWSPSPYKGRGARVRVLETPVHAAPAERAPHPRRFLRRVLGVEPMSGVGASLMGALRPRGCPSPPYDNGRGLRLLRTYRAKSRTWSPLVSVEVAYLVEPRKVGLLDGSLVLFLVEVSPRARAGAPAARPSPPQPSAASRASGSSPWLKSTLSDACGTPARRASANCETSRSVSQRLMYAASVSPGCCVVMVTLYTLNRLG